MSRVVLDGSAVAAVLWREPGHEEVIPHLRGSLMSIVNLAEVIGVSQVRGPSPEMVEYALKRLQIELVAFDDEQARLVASIFSKSHSVPLTFADQASMALAVHRGLPLFTSKQNWIEHDIGVEIHLIRERTLQ